MTEHNNPLMRANPGQPRGRLTAGDLHAHCEALNKTNFVRASNQPYRVIRGENGLHEITRGVL